MPSGFSIFFASWVSEKSIAAMPTEHSWMARWFALPGWAQNEVEEKVANWAEAHKAELPSGFLAIRMGAYLLEKEALQALREQDANLMYRIPEVMSVEDAVALASQDDQMLTFRQKMELRRSLDNLLAGLKPEAQILQPSEES